MRSYCTILTPWLSHWIFVFGKGRKRPLAGVAIGGWLWQFAAVNKARPFLLATLRRVIGGGDVTNEELDAAIPTPADLRGTERKAWHGLSYWADDDDIRAKDPAYAPSRRRQLADLLSALENEKV